MNIGVIGTGYVGLVTAACFADLGHRVIGMDNDRVKVRKLRRGIMPIFEPGLKELVGENVRQKRLSFTDNAGELVRKSEIIFIAVGTPSAPSGEVDVRYVREAACVIAKHINGPKIIVNKSTVPVGMADIVASIIREKMKRKCGFDVVSNPEFLREGSAIHDSMNPDRVLIGASSPAAGKKIAKLFTPLKAPILITDPRSAEMIKYASNAFLATKISFINEISQICDRVHADVTRVAEGMGLDKRIGKEFLQAGAGYGGSCFPKDVSALEHIARKESYEFEILQAVMRVNERQKLSILEKIKSAVATLEGKTVGVLGLAFKPNTDDLRDAVSLTIIPALREKGVRIKAYDPVAMGKARPLFRDVKFCSSAYETASGSDALVLLTEWNEFKELDLIKIKSLLKSPPVIVDGRNLFDPARMRALGFIYKSVGR